MKKILLLVACLFAVYTTSFSQEDCVGPLTVTIQGSDTGTPLDAQESIIVQPTCGPDGSIAISVTGGTPDYELQWMKDNIEVQMPQDITETDDGIDVVVNNLGEGVYSVMIADDSGCEMPLGPWTLIQPDGIEITADASEPECNVPDVDFNGSITLTAVTGGTVAGDYSFAWTTNGGSGLDATAQDQTGLGAGEYTVVVTDDNNCTTEMTWTLTAPELFEVAATEENPDCHTDNGESNGSITLAVTGGTAEYSYAWTGDDDNLVADAGNQTGLGAGVYSVVITDANGCQISTSVTLEAPEAIVVALSKVDPTCSADNGDANGSIDITVSGGTGDYGYAWTGGTGLDEDGTNQTGLDNGTYTVIVTDASGCTVTEEITLEGPDAITAEVVEVDPSCGNIQDGTITLTTVTGGSGDYSYNWNTTGGTGVTTTDQDQSELGAGVYMLTITDGAGCTATFEYELEAPEAILATVSKTDPECFSTQGDANGTISLAVTGGTGDLTYAWTSDNGATLVDNSNSQSELPAGVYTVVITDGSSCTVTEEITLLGATEIDLESEVVDPTCSGGNGGIWLAVSPSGDTNNEYTYTWTTDDGSGLVDGNKNQNGLSPGTYDLTVTNSKGCTISDSYTINAVDGITATADVTTEILCNADASGIVTVTAEGGTGDLTYSLEENNEFTTFQESNIFEGLAAGSYKIRVQDANDCYIDVVLTVEEPEALTAGTCTEAQDLCNANEGEIKVQASGGVAPYSVTWTSDNGGTLNVDEGTISVSGESFTFENAQGGKNYAFKVTDTNGCIIQ